MYLFISFNYVVHEIDDSVLIRWKDKSPLMLRIFQSSYFDQTLLHKFNKLTGIFSILEYTNKNAEINKLLRSSLFKNHLEIRRF